MTEPAAPTSAGGVRLDLDLARVAITKLEGVRAELLTVLSDAAEFGRLTANSEPGRDAVSTEAFQLLGTKAYGGPGSLGDAVEGAIAHVNGLIDQMNADITAQEELDRDGARALRAP